METKEGIMNEELTREDARIFINGNSGEESPENVLKGVMGEKKFNWCAFFFSVIYCMYRKCYKGAVIYLVIGVAEIGLSIYMLLTWGQTIWQNLLSLGVAIVFGFMFYPLYRKTIITEKEKVSDIADEESRTKALQNRGGTSARNMWLTILAYVVVSVVLFKIVYSYLA